MLYEQLSEGINQYTEEECIEKAKHIDILLKYVIRICYWNIDNCKNAWVYYEEAVALGGRPITEEYTKDLKKRCKR